MLAREAIGFPISISGAVGYIINGLGAQELPALLDVALASVLTAPFGAKLAHTLPVPTVN